MEAIALFKITTLLSNKFVKECLVSNSAIERSLLESLNAYVKHFETPNTREDLLAIASSILTFQQKQEKLAIAPDLSEALIQQVVTQFKVETIVNSIVDSTTETLIKEVNQWRQSLESQVLNTLNAYVQNFLSERTLNLTETILSIIPLVEYVQLRKSQAESLIQGVISKFDLQTVLEPVIDPKFLAIAQKLSELLKFGSLEELLKKTLLGDQTLINNTLENVTESLVNNELSKILGNNSLQFNIDLDSQQLMVKQVTLKLNVMQSSAPPSKSNQEIAKQVDDEIEKLRKLIQEKRGVVDISKPTIFGELQVGIPK
jgi:hypothetical protein